MKKEDFDPTSILANDGKRQEQQDDTRDNKKQKHQENTIPLTITETPLPQLITSSDPVPTPTDPLLETLVIPPPPQIVLQPHITESTTNETPVNYPNQEQTTTKTHGFKHHSLMAIAKIDHPSESPSQELATSTSILVTEPLLSHLATPMTPLTTPPDRAQLRLTPRPSEYESWSNNKKYRWRQRFEPKE